MTIYDAVWRSIVFIENNLHQDIGVLDVATAVSFSQFYFSREFSRHVHSSIYDYIIRRKLSEAYQSLFTSRPRIVELAFRYGFQSHEGFSRAFRKMFGENPSEVSVYKPYLIYEPIDEPYLRFLSDLKLQMMADNIGNTYYVIDSVTDLMDTDQLLVLLDKDHLLSHSCLLKGSISPKEPEALSTKLKHMKHMVRMFTTDMKHSYRYFLNNLYDPNEMGGNYILLSRREDTIDFFIPAKSEHQNKAISLP